MIAWLETPKFDMIAFMFRAVSVFSDHVPKTEDLLSDGRYLTFSSARNLSKGVGSQTMAFRFPCPSWSHLKDAYILLMLVDETWSKSFPQKRLLSWGCLAPGLLG